MGCLDSKPNTYIPGSEDKGISKVGFRSSSKNMRLLEEYSVGQMLGEGAFGVVSSCRKRSTGEEFAVKMVDKVETPVEAIQKEADLLQQLDHANIVKCHGVFYERCFVCIVMDKYAGGDLVEGLQRHLKDRGQINCHDIVHVTRQMGAGIQYLHQRNVVHRDIKGDNFLMDRKDMTDHECHIVLADFGAAVQVRPGERLSAGVGTKIFWAPEIFDNDYGPKVDVWAMGVVTYGLMTGRFPFPGETDIRTKEVKLSKRVHPTCQDFIRKMLDKVERRRPTSEILMSHQWVAGEAMRASVDGGSKQEDAESTADRKIFRDDADDGIKERRQELIDRMGMEQQVREKKNVGGAGRSRHGSAHLQKLFVLPDKQAPGMKLKYEWWNESKVKSSGILEVEGQVKPAQIEAVGEGCDIQMFVQMLEDHNIDVKLFGVSKAKTLEQLASEVHSGAARLMLDATQHKKLVRVVDVVVLRLRSPPVDSKEPPRLLIETEECFPDGRKRETLRLPGTKKQPHENTRQTAARIVRDMLNLTDDTVKFNLDRIDRREEETESPSYPGVRTVYRKDIVECSLVTKDPSQLAKAGLPAFAPWTSRDQLGNTKTWSWMSDEVAESHNVKLKREEAEAISTLVRAPSGLGEDALRQYLTSTGIDVSKFDQDNTESVKGLSAELIKGEATLMQDCSGLLVRVVDVIVMIIRNPAENTVLVQTERILPDKPAVVLNRLPWAKRRPDENQFLSASRFICRQLEIDENMVKLLTDVLIVEEKKPSPSYPGLSTVYRKRLIRAELTSEL